MLHFIGGVIIPRRVLCPWRPHLLDSTLPAVARATAACFVTGEWVVGRGVGLLSPGKCSSGWQAPRNLSSASVAAATALRHRFF